MCQTQNNTQNPVSYSSYKLARNLTRRCLNPQSKNFGLGCMMLLLKRLETIFFLAIFISEKDMVEVLDKSPWSFDRRLILLKRFTSDLSSGNVFFKYSPFWIRVFNIPIKSMNSSIGSLIANEIGVPILVDAPKSGFAWGP